MPSKIEAVLFDYGGVLTDGGKDGDTPNAVADFFGVERSQLDIGDLHDMVGRGVMSADDFIAALNQRYGTERQITGPDYTGINGDIYQPRQLVKQLVAKLRSNGIITGILSNVNSLIADSLYELEAYDGFDPLILSHEVGARKPGSEIYKIALARLSVPPESVIFIDDKPANLVPARELGMSTVHAYSDKQLAKAIPAILRERNEIDIG